MLDIRVLEQEQIRSDIPAFRVGDTVRVNVKVVEGTRERIQAFEGVVIARKGGSVRETFTVRRVSYGIGVERVFPPSFPEDRHHPDYEARQGQESQAVLSERSRRQVGQDQGKDYEIRIANKHI